MSFRLEGSSALLGAGSARNGEITAGISPLRAFGAPVGMTVPAWGGFGFFFGPFGLAVIAVRRREKPMKEAQVILNVSAHGGYTSASKAAQALRETKQ